MSEVICHILQTKFNRQDNQDKDMAVPTYYQIVLKEIASILGSISRIEIRGLLLPTKTFSCKFSIISATVEYMTLPQLDHDQNHYKRAKNISPFHPHLCLPNGASLLRSSNYSFLLCLGNITCQNSLFIAWELWFQFI